MKPIKLPKMDEEEIKSLIEKKNLCRIAFIDDDYPYISPFQYVLFNNSLYFHFTDYGKKKKILLKNSNVCVSIEDFSPDLSKYHFISIQGKLKLVKEPREKVEVVKKMINKAKKTYSTKFLSAHGFERESGWDSFQVEDQLIYKLEEVGSRIGLKSKE
jgi:nitroimidazol reductase NimA-like FMN-containing flavoprotein (pyridoxamine 5'-phosphate oxidase superfamily)